MNCRAMPNTCYIDNCDDDAAKRGLCNRHYLRLWRHGSATAGRTLNHEAWDYMIAHMWDECPRWPYLRNVHGRAVVYDRRLNRQRPVQQIVCEIANGPRPSSRHDAAHECGEGHNGCFGARCLSWKTRSENQMDRVVHGTSNRGERHGLAKLTKTSVLAIRRLTGRVAQQTLADKYGVSRVTISNIQTRRSWQWLP